jgi:hypothetical protein
MTSDDPSTETWRDAMREQLHGLLDGLKPQPGGEDTVERMRGRWEACSRHREHIQQKLSETQLALAKSQQDLTRMEAERDEYWQELSRLRGDCAWRDLAITAMRERDLTRAQLDDAIAAFRADKEGRS